MSLMHNKGLRVSKSSLFLLKYCWPFVTQNKKARGAFRNFIGKKKKNEIQLSMFVLQTLILRQNK